MGRNEHPGDPSPHRQGLRAHEDRGAEDTLRTLRGGRLWGRARWLGRRPLGQEVSDSALKGTRTQEKTWVA